VRDLIKNLDRADRSITGLKAAAQDSGAELQTAINKAMSIADELQLMTDSGDRLASRLEQLVDGVKPALARANNMPAAAPASAGAAAKPADQQASYAQHLRKLDAAEEKAARANFNIRDPEAERGQAPAEGKMSLEDDGSGQGLYSEAERDLYRAIKSKGATR
jgi:hypothetical protein